MAEFAASDNAERDGSMIERLIAARIGNPGEEMTAQARGAWGKAASTAGIVCNALLFLIKLLAGMLSGSMALTADALNNLSDAAASVVSFLGFRLAEKPADEDHPYGHGRYEYLAGLLVAGMIIVLGIELMKESAVKILHPQRVEADAFLVAVLAFCIAAKLRMAAFYRRVGRAIDSGTLEAAGQDSRNDALATSAVLASALIGQYTGWMPDGWMSAAVSAFILYSGAALAKETIGPVLGKAPSRAYAEEICARLESYPGVLGAHDLLVHDYGPGRQYASVHLEMDAAQDPLAAHALIDRIERELLAECGLHMVVHYDPVERDDPRLAAIKALAQSAAKEIDPRASVHDLRITDEGTKLRAAFDCVTPYDLALSDAEVRGRIEAAIEAQYPDCRCEITIEHG